MIYLSRIIDGATAGNLSIAQAYIADNTPPEKRAHAFGLIGIAFGLGFFIGPALTGFLAGHYGIPAPIYLAAAMSATSIFATATLLEGGRPPRAQAVPGPARLASTRPTSRDRRCVRSCCSSFFMLSFSTFISGFALFAERRFEWNGHPSRRARSATSSPTSGFLGIILQGGSSAGW